MFCGWDYILLDYFQEYMSHLMPVDIDNDTLSLITNTSLPHSNMTEKLLTRTNLNTNKQEACAVIHGIANDIMGLP